MTNEAFSKLLTAIKDALKKQNVEESLYHISKTFQFFEEERQNTQKTKENLQGQLNTASFEMEQTLLKLHRSLKELKFSSAYLESILKITQDGILFIDTDGLILSHNQAALDLLEKKSNELVLKNYFQLFPDDFLGFSMKEALDLGKNLKEKTSLNGKKIEVEAIFVSDAPQPYQGITVLLKDVSELNRLNEEAARSCRLKEIGQVATTVAHEINNPLGGIRGFASLLARDLENKPPLKDMAEQIVSGTKVLERLVSSILHFTRPLCLKAEKTNLSNLIKDLIKLIKMDPTFSEEKTFKCHVPGQNLFAYVDNELLKSALLNLVRNALEAVDKNGFISISLIQNNNQAVIDITDNGKGMKETELKNLFSPFFTTKATGNGLGLAEAHKIITSHMGKINVRSTEEKGTTFTVTLPLKKG